MANFPFPAVTDWVVSVNTAPEGGGNTFTFRVDVFVPNSGPIPLAVNSAEELAAVVGVLQIPVGRLLFNPQTRSLIRTLL
jgi:hypothetical protein